jgi:hypothetical protein
MAKLEQSKKVANYMEVPGMISTIAQLAKVAASNKQADMTGMQILGSNTAVGGGIVGGGIGGALGLAAGALNSRKGKRIHDTMTGGMRGLVGGGLIGAGAGGGLGIGGGSVIPMKEMIDSLKNEGRPLGHQRIEQYMHENGHTPVSITGRMLAGALGGAGVGGLASHALLGNGADKDKDEEKEGSIKGLAKAAAEKTAFSSGMGMLPKPPASTALRYGVTRPTAGPGGSGGMSGIIGGMLPKPTMPYAAGGPGGTASTGAGVMPKPAGGGGGFGGMLPKPTMQYAAGGPGGMASTGAGAVQPKPMAPQPQLTLQQAGQQVNQAMQDTIQNKTHGQNPATAMQMAPQPKLTLQQAGQQVNQAMRSTIRNKTHGQNPATAMQMAPQPQPKPMAPQTQPKLTLQQAGQQVNQAMRSTIRNKTHGQNPATAMQMAPQHTNPSDQAHAMLADLNKRRRAAGGEVSDAAAVQARANELLNMSNTMRNAPGYQPPGAGNSPRDQADAIRQKLNAMRRAAGGEVPEAAQMMREMNRLSAEYDRSALPNAAARALGKAAAEKVALAGLAGGSLGAVGGGALGNMAARGLVGPYKNEKLDSGEDDDDDESEEKEAACSKKKRYMQMLKRRG